MLKGYMQGVNPHSAPQWCTHTLLFGEGATTDVLAYNANKKQVSEMR